MKHLRGEEDASRLAAEYPRGITSFLIQNIYTALANFSSGDGWLDVCAIKPMNFDLNCLVRKDTDAI